MIRQNELFLINSNKIVGYQTKNKYHDMLDDICFFKVFDNILNDNLNSGQKKSNSIQTPLITITIHESKNYSSSSSH